MRLLKLLTILFFVIPLVFSYVVIEPVNRVVGKTDSYGSVTISEVYIVKNEGPAVTANITFNLDNYIIDAKACEGNLTCDVELNSSFSDNGTTKQLTILNLKLDENSTKVITLFEKSEAIQNIEFLFFTRKTQQGDYQPSLYVVNPSPYNFNGKIILPIDPIYLKDDNNVDVDDGVNQISAKVIKLQDKYFIVIPINISSNSYKYLSLDLKYLPDFRSRSWYYEIFSPTEGIITVKRYIDPLVLNFSIEVFPSIFSDILLPFKILDNGTTRFIQTDLPIYYTPSKVIQLKKHLFNLSSIFYEGKKVNLTFYKVDENTFQEITGKNFSEAGITTQSGYVYLYNGTWGDEQEGNTTFMVWEDKDEAGTYNTLLVDLNKNRIFNESLDLVLEVDENKTYSIYIGRQNESYSYVLRKTPTVNGEDEINITFTRLPAKIFNPTLKGIYVFLPKEGLQFFDTTDYVFLFDGYLYFLPTSNYTEDIDNLSLLNDKLIQISLGTKYPVDEEKDFEITQVNNTTLEGFLDPKGKDVYYGISPVYDYTTGKIYSAKVALMDGTLYIIKGDDIFNVSQFYKFIDFSQSDVFLRANNIILEYELIPSSSEYSLKVTGYDIKPIFYNTNYSTTFEKISSDEYVSTQGLTYEWEDNIETTIPILIKKVIFTPFNPTSYTCYVDGKMVDLKRIDTQKFLLEYPIDAGVNHSITCYFYTNSEDKIEILKDTIEGKFETLLYFVKINNPAKVMIEFPLKINQLPYKVCINYKIDSDCDKEIQLDLFRYKFLGSYLVGYYPIYLSEPQYVKVVLENVENPLDYKVSSSLEIRKNIINYYVNLFVKNERDINLPYTQLNILLNEPPLSIFQIKEGYQEDVSNKVKVNEIGNSEYQYNFVFSNFIPNALPGFSKLEERQYIIQLKTDNLKVSYIKGGIEGGEYENGTYTLIKKVENNGLNSYDIKLFFDEVPKSFIKKFITFLIEDKTYFRKNASSSLYNIYIEDSIKGKTSKEYGIRYIKDNIGNEENLWSGLYTDLGVIFDENLRKLINDFADKREDRYLLKGQMYIKEIQDYIDKIVSLILKGKKEDVSDDDAKSVFYGIGLIKNFNWDNVINSDYFLVYYNDYLTIKDLKDKLSSKIKEFLDYVDNVGNEEEALSNLKSCLITHEDDREYCYEKYQLLNTEINFIENCLKKNNYLSDGVLTDTEVTHCLENLKKFENQGEETQNQIEETEIENTTKKENSQNENYISEITNLITNILLKISDILADKQNYDPKDIDKVKNIEEDVKNIKDNLKNYNGDWTLLKNKLLNYLNILNSLKPNPLLPLKEELTNELNKIISELEVDKKTISYPPEDKLLSLNNPDLLNQYTQLKNKLDQIIESLNNLNNKIETATSKEELNKIKDEINQKKAEYEATKEKLLKVIDKINKALESVNTQKPVSKPKPAPKPAAPQPENMPQETNKKGSSSWFLFILPILIIAIVAGGGYYYYIKKIKPKKNKNNQEETKEGVDKKPENEKENKEETKVAEKTQKIEETPKEIKQEDTFEVNTDLLTEEDLEEEPQVFIEEENPAPVEEEKPEKENKKEEKQETENIKNKKEEEKRDKESTKLLEEIKNELKNLIR